MEAAPPSFADDAPANMIDVVPPTPSQEPTLITMPPPDPEADELLTRLTSLLSPTEAVPVLIEKSLMEECGDNGKRVFSLTGGNYDVM